MTRPTRSRLSDPASPADIVALLRHGLPAAAAAAPAEPATPALPRHATWKDAGALTIHGADIAETIRERTLAPLTPAGEMFLRNHRPCPPQRPDADAMQWEIEFDGVLVPVTLSLKKLLAFGTSTVTCVVQCSGNGRALLAEGTPGTPWRVGGAACVTYTGVPLRLVIAGLGGGVDAPRFITATGGEPLPSAADPAERVERSVPVAALRDAILAFAMNGAPLPATHGGPVRLVVPGYYAVNHVKYVARIALTREESDVNIQRLDYRMRPAGAAPTPDHPSTWAMPPKSWIAAAQFVGPRRLEVRGVAFGGTSAPASVEITANDGETWTTAWFDSPDLGPFAWRTFRATVHLPHGERTVACRVAAEDGAVQPAEVPANAQGFGNNGWRSHAVTVFVD